MKTTALLATLVGASVLLFIQPVFAQSDNDSIAEIGSGAWGSSDPVDSDVVPPSNSATRPSYSETRDDGLLAPVPKLPPAPGPAYSEEAMPSSYGATAPMYGATAPMYGDTAPMYGDTAPSYGDTTPSFAETWGDGAVLMPAPGQPEALAPEQPEARAPESMFVPQGPVGLIEPPGLTPISPTSPELIPPDAFARPAGGFHSTVGGFNGRFH
jgi:hypothetical protein